MKTKLQILLLEDSVADAELIAHELERAGFSFSMTRVQTEKDFCHELETVPPDLILSDHGLPSFDGFKALEIVRESLPQLPFIFVSGSNDQGMVVEMYEQGATDYVFKRDIGDLKTAIHNALEPSFKVLPPPEPQKTIPFSAQSELKLQFSIESLAPPVFSPTVGHLHFCPRCCRARDETNRIVLMEDYCRNRVEVVIARQICAECDWSHQ
jgi:CheY-like chemotaxis protein